MREQNNLAFESETSIQYVRTEFISNERLNQISINEKSDTFVFKEGKILLNQALNRIFIGINFQGGYGWLVLLVTVWLNGFTLSMWTTFTLLYPKLIEFYKGSEEHNVAYMAWIGMLNRKNLVYLDVFLNFLK